ncbi:hypothetical protein ACFQT0_19015 [Hymenobacter humi]|uniref:SH3 domain-containing protein n=1 Tax=Hymenobacter humi TaxID=1411620 RepID=A0ABW2U7H3_9BACT
MSQQNQAKTYPPLRGGKGPGLRGSTPRRGLSSKAKTAIIIVAVGLLGGAGLGLLMAPSDDEARSPDSELIVDPSPASSKESAKPAEPAAPKETAVAEPVGQQPGQGRRYQVIVGTAYFFDAPQQSTPNGKYLRRGDVFYGEGELNGFVKSGFVNPDGTRSTGWLKSQELKRLSESPAPRVVRTPKPRPAAPPAVPNDYSTAAPAAKSAPVERAAPSRSGQTAVVQAARSYFYDSPDLSTPRKAHCVRGDKVRLGETRGDAVYVTFTNWEKVTTTGWMRKDALGI